MHIPDGFLSAPVAATTWLAAGAALAATLRAERRDSAKVPSGVLGSLAAFVFAAQMVNLPVAPGTSGHLVGATLAAILVGPWRALIIMAVVLAIQAMLFQDGGFTAYGANLLDMGLAGSFVGFGVVSLATRFLRGLRGHVVGAVLGAFTATLCGAVLTSLWLALSGLYPLRGILPLMLVTHTAIGVLEAALTGAILVTLLRWRPDLVAGASGAARPSPAGRRRRRRAGRRARGGRLPRAVRLPAPRRSGADGPGSRLLGAGEPDPAGAPGGERPVFRPPRAPGPGPGGPDRNSIRGSRGLDGRARTLEGRRCPAPVDRPVSSSPPASGRCWPPRPRPPASAAGPFPRPRG